MAVPTQILVDAALMAVAPEVGTTLMLNHLTNFLLRSTYRSEENDVQNPPDNEALTRIADNLQYAGEETESITQVLREKDMGLHEVNMTIESEEKLQAWKYKDYQLTG